MAIKTAAELKTYFEAGDRPTEQQFIDLIDSSVPTYKSYVATINQSGTNAPVATNINQNELTDSPTFYYDAVGKFRIASDDFGNLSDGKVSVFCGSGNQSDSSKSLDCYTTTAPVGRDANQLKCEVALETIHNNTFTDGLIFNTQIEIRVYI